MIFSLFAALAIAQPVPRSEFRVPRGFEPGQTRNVERGTLNLHDVHLTHTRMVLDGKVVACRVRLFKDDLEKALQAYGKQPQFHITAEARADSTPGPLDHAALREEHALVLDAISTLPGNQQEAFRLKFEHGLTYREISSVMNMPLSTVNYTIAQALAAVRRRLRATIGIEHTTERASRHEH